MRRNRTSHSNKNTHAQHRTRYAANHGVLMKSVETRVARRANKIGTKATNYKNRDGTTPIDQPREGVGIARTRGKGFPRDYQDPVPTTPTNKKRNTPICGKKRTGRSTSGPGICCQTAGWGTNHPGWGPCKLHGGTSPTTQVAALRAKVRLNMTVYGTPRKVGPHEAILEEIHRTAGAVDWLGNVIRQLGADPDTITEDELSEAIVEIQDQAEGEDTPKKKPLKNRKPIGPDRTLVQWTALGMKPSIWLETYQKEREHLVAVCKAAVGMGVAERTVKLAEDQGRMIAMAFQNFIRDPELQLNPGQLAVANELARKHILSVRATDANADLLELAQARDEKQRQKGVQMAKASQARKRKAIEAKATETKPTKQRTESTKRGARAKAAK